MKDIPTHISKLILTYISKDINEEEFNELKNWINQNPKHKQLFFDYLYVYKKSRKSKLLKKINLNDSWNDVHLKLISPLTIVPNKSEIRKKRFKRTLGFMKYAAALAVLLGVNYLYQNGYFKTQSKVIIPTNDITLELPDGKIKIINEENISKIINAKGQVVGKQNNTQLSYVDAGKEKVLEYNTLTIPYGKKFELELSDGTKVHLNAGSSLKYPVAFLKGHHRKVFLKGEAYFDVSKDKEHPFIVNVDDMNVRVLGTEFNISSYPEDKNINTVLVEGSISIYEDNELYDIKKSTLLTPGNKAIWNKNNKYISVKKADVDLATAWLDGRLVFRRMTFDEILKKLERRYNVTIVNHNKVIENQQFGASFDIETIEQIMESFNENYEIDYKIENNKIIIN